MKTKNVEYTGPQAEIATLTGSPLWGVDDADKNEVVINWVEKHGFEHHSTRRYETAYGTSADVQHFTTPSGRSVIRIPSYGGVKGEDWLYNHASDKVFWILWQAGVKVLIVGGTSGTADRRGLFGNKNAIEPGDFVLPWSFKTSPRHRGLPGTPYETAWPKHDLLLDDPFCTALAPFVAERVRELYSPKPFRKVHTTAETRAVLVLPRGITFETDYDIMEFMATLYTLNKMQPGRPPIVTLHGDCINPVLTRLLGMHMLYYHLPCNWAQSIKTEVGITNTLYPLYTDIYPQTVLELEAWMLNSLPIPDGSDCACVDSLHTAPEVFSKAMTQK